MRAQGRSVAFCAHRLPRHRAHHRRNILLVIRTAATVWSRFSSSAASSAIHLHSNGVPVLLAHQPHASVARSHPAPPSSHHQPDAGRPNHFPPPATSHVLLSHQPHDVTAAHQHHNPHTTIRHGAVSTKPRPQYRADHHGRISESTTPARVPCAPWPCRRPACAHGRMGPGSAFTQPTCSPCTLFLIIICSGFIRLSVPLHYHSYDDATSNHSCCCS